MKLTKRKINKICADAKEHLTHHLRDNVVYPNEIRVTIDIVIFKDREKIKTGYVSKIDYKFN